MEPLSDALSLLKMRASGVHGLHAGGSWSISFPHYEGTKFDAVARGGCWLRVEGEPEPYRFTEGDCFLLTRGRPFVLASDLSLPPVPFAQALRYDERGMAHCGSGDEVYLIGGHFLFEGGESCPLFQSLPLVAPVRAASSEAGVLRWSLEQFTEELHRRQPGNLAAAEHLAHLMLIQVLRLYLEAAGAERHGWLFALRDAHLREVLGAVHGDVCRRWTLQAMARVAGMSRSGFCARFKEVVGRSPLEYLQGWRMHVAADRLRTTERNVGAIASEVGYESEAAFSTAFKKVHGLTPRAHRRAGSEPPFRSAS